MTQNIQLPIDWNPHLTKLHEGTCRRLPPASSFRIPKENFLIIIGTMGAASMVSGDTSGNRKESTKDAELTAEEAAAQITVMDGEATVFQFSLARGGRHAALPESFVIGCPPACGQPFELFLRHREPNVAITLGAEEEESSQDVVDGESSAGATGGALLVRLSLPASWESGEREENVHEIPTVQRRLCATVPRTDVAVFSSSFPRFSLALNTFPDCEGISQRLRASVCVVNACVRLHSLYQYAYCHCGWAMMRTRSPECKCRRCGLVFPIVNPRLVETIADCHKSNDIQVRALVKVERPTPITILTSCDMKGFR
eukprot:GEMP01036377.1.p1 GENE.GEMP01036377.1~~GEMP01036377.1.p1  ORF type:complete len:314 (+),score=55.98 GEMP01036377.1:164-1105(+)